MRLNESVGNYHGFEPLEKADSIGVEIELEAQSEFPPCVKTDYYWRQLADGSLRSDYNAEYVLRRPRSVKAVTKAIDKLKEKIDQSYTQLVDSVRAGTHVHINVRDLTFRELWTMVTCWYILEELLTDTLCGEGRSGNHFCLRAKDADVLLVRVGQVLREGNINRLGRDDIRYSALNFVSLHKYGSIEFRALRSPLDFSVIKEWVGVLINLKINSKKYLNPRHVIENFSYGGEENFLKSIVGNDLTRKIIGRDPLEWEHKLRSGMRMAQEIGFAVDDWDKNEIVPAEPVAPEPAIAWVAPKWRVVRGHDLNLGQIEAMAKVRDIDIERN